MKSFNEYIKLRESTSPGEGYTEAGELMSQPVPEIIQFLQQIGVPHKPPGSQWSKEDNNFAIKLGQIIDSTDANGTLNAKDIVNLKNLANKPSDQGIPQKLAQISGQPNAAEQYVQIMQNRDSGEGRSRGYDVGDLIKKLQSGSYSPPVLLKANSGLITIGGRTRLYAALALGIPIKVKILDASLFKGKMEITQK